MAKEESKDAQVHKSTGGGHGPKAHEAFVENLHAKHPDSDERENAPQEGRNTAGKHRLTEDRQQHDDAENDSETNRLSR